MSTYLERLRWQHEEDTAGVYAEPSLEEQWEIRDEAFRHWDTYTFARNAASPAAGYLARANGGGLACHAAGSPPPPTFASRPPLRPLGGTPDASGGAADDGELVGGAPKLTQHTIAQMTPTPGRAGGEPIGSTIPPEADGFALPFEHLMWSA